MVETNEFKKALINAGDTMESLAKKWNISREYLSSIVHNRSKNLRIEYLINEYTRANSR